MSITIGEENYLYEEEVATKLGIAVTTFRIQVRAKEVPLPIPLKRRRIWAESEIDKYLEERKHERER